jgi:photosystem II biogenesis protein Psp29
MWPPVFVALGGSRSLSLLLRAAATTLISSLTRPIPPSSHKTIIKTKHTRNQKKTTTKKNDNTTANPATVADTKQAFLRAYPRPIPAMYSTVVQELLVQQHFMRYNSRYSYSPVFALGVVSVFDQVLDAFSDEGDRAAVFSAYVSSLGEDPAQYRRDAQSLESLAKEAGSPDALKPDAEGNDLQRALADVARQSAEGSFLYNKFFAIGLFRLLELTGAKEPAALDRLVKAVGVKPDAVSKDLLLYKGVLSKLSVAKELMRDFVERERRKAAEREAEKAAKKSGGGDGGGQPAETAPAAA